MPCYATPVTHSRIVIREFVYVCRMCLCVIDTYAHIRVWDTSIYTPHTRLPNKPVPRVRLCNLYRGLWIGFILTSLLHVRHNMKTELQTSLITIIVIMNCNQSSADSNSFLRRFELELCPLMEIHSKNVGLHFAACRIGMVFTLPWL